MARVSTIEIMERIRQALVAHSAMLEAERSEVGPSLAGELLKQSMLTISTIWEASNAYEASIPKVFPRAQATHSVGERFSGSG